MTAVRADIPAHERDGAPPVQVGTGGGALGSVVRLSASEFAERFEAAAKPLWAIAAAIVRNRTTAHDVVQEAAVVALGKLNEFDASTNFTAWAGQIVRFVALNESRRLRRDPAATTDPIILQAGAPAARATAADSAEFAPAVQAALDSLDELPRTCLLMRTTLDLSYKQIADALGVPEGTAMSHVHRARATMRAALSSAVTASAGGAP